MKALVRLMASLVVTASASWAQSTSLEDVRPVATGAYMAPLWSPDSKQLVFSGFKYRGLFVMPTAGGPVRALTSDPWAGFRPIWSQDGHALVYSIREASGEKSRAIDLQGNLLRTIPAFRSPSRLGRTEVYLEGNEIVLLTAGSAPLQLTKGGDKFFGPMISSDGKKVIYQGLATGIFLHEVDSGRTLNLGRGNHPTFSSDSQQIFFDVSTDDGRDLLSSDLFVHDLRQRLRAQLTFTKDRLEQRPSLSPDMKHLVFDADGGIFVGTLVSK